MARGKKKETLTPEERLQAALVPEGDQPYKVPENWCWIHLGELYQINPKNLAEDFVDAAFIPMEKITPGFVNEYSFDVQPWCKAKKGHTQFADGDVAFAKISPCFENRKSMLLNNLPNGIGGGTTELIILRQSHMNQKYTFWFISQEQFIRGGIATYSGTVGQQRISMDYVRTYPIPVPPLAEQQRIVDRIESLFAKLDEAKQKAQDALDSFETRKAAILHKAFTGELTAQWRKEHGVGMESWDTKLLSRVTKNHDSERIPLSQAERRKLARVYDYYGASGVIDKVDRFLFEGRKLLIGEDGANLVTRSKPIAFIAEGQYWVNNHAHVLSVTSEMLLDFLCHYINSIDLTPYVTGSAQPKMTQAKMNTIPVPVPTVDEQAEMVCLLDDLLAKEQQTKEAAEGVLEQIGLIKKAILARAFRGELGTNDPSEESAVELLKQIL